MVLTPQNRWNIFTVISDFVSNHVYKVYKSYASTLL